MKNRLTYNRKMKKITSRSFQDFCTDKQINEIISKIEDEIIIDQAPNKLTYPIFNGEKWIEDQEKLLIAKINTHQKYLLETDWYSYRFSETGKAIPTGIKAKRQDCRSLISSLREEIKAIEDN